MSYYYSEPHRESDPHALPDVQILHSSDMPETFLSQDGGEPGFYFWFCFPGCLPDSDPFGPFDSAEAALHAAREM